MIQTILADGDLWADAPDFHDFDFVNAPETELIDALHEFEFLARGQMEVVEVAPLCGAK